MAELTAQDRLQPALLDRLTDDSPGSAVEPPEARVLSRTRLRDAVLRDLSWLFNATRAEPDPASSNETDLRAWRECPEARRSVLNYGLPAFSGSTLSSLDFSELEEAVRQAIIAFEPRIDPPTVEVEVTTSGPVMTQHNLVRLIIRGNLWNQPVPLELLLRTDLDVETGMAVVKDLKV